MASMWRRLPRSSRGKENQDTIGNPVLLETSLDAKQLQQFPDVAEVQNAHRANHSNLASRQLPELPFRAMPAQESTPSRRVVSDTPTASAYSISSQPSPRHTHYRQSSQQTAGPSSPTYDVSPVDSDFDENQTSKRPAPRMTSQIPVRRKVTPGSQAALSRQRAGSSNEPTRWDDYTGEITTNATGKPATVKPGSPLYALRSSESTGNLRQQMPQKDDGQPKATVKEKASRLANAGLSIDTRPPWRGASGRHAIVAGVSDTPGQPVPVPRRSPPESEVPKKKLSSSDAGSDTSETLAASVPRGDPSISDETIRPTPPLKAGNKTPRNNSQSTPVTMQTPTGYPSPLTPTHDIVVTGAHQYPVRPVSAVEEDDLQHHNSTKKEPGNKRLIPRKSVETQRSHRSDGENAKSRFSWTTYDTDTSYQRSPPPSPPPPLPANFGAQSYATPTSAPQPRPDPDPSNLPKRPDPQSPVTPTIGFHRKPVANMVPRDELHEANPPNMFAPYTARPSVISSISSPSSGNFKALPPPPAALTAASLIDSLQAQLDDLATQRHNIQRVIRDFLATQPQNPLVSDLKARREAEKKLACWRDDLSAISVLEHAVGLRLHRAWKRKERVDGAEPSALWIRRVAV